MDLGAISTWAIAGVSLVGGLVSWAFHERTGNLDKSIKQLKDEMDRSEAELRSLNAILTSDFYTRAEVRDHLDLQIAPLKETIDKTVGLIEKLSTKVDNLSINVAVLSSKLSKHDIKD